MKILWMRHDSISATQTLKSTSTKTRPLLQVLWKTWKLISLRSLMPSLREEERARCQKLRVSSSSAMEITIKAIVSFSIAPRNAHHLSMAPSFRKYGVAHKAFIKRYNRNPVTSLPRNMPLRNGKIRSPLNSAICLCFLRKLCLYP